MMGHFVAFVLGIVASLVATWFFQSQPYHPRFPILGFLTNPRLTLRCIRKCPERAIQNRIRELFAAWETRDIEMYKRVWHDSACRETGPLSRSRQSKAEIISSFQGNLQRFKSASTKALVFRDIRTFGLDKARAEVYYRLEFVRAEDELPIIEEARELYSLIREGEDWFIVSNIDYYFEVRHKPFQDEASWHLPSDAPANALPYPPPKGSATESEIPSRHPA